MSYKIRYKHLFDQMRVSNANYNGKWLSQKELHTAEARWTKRSYESGKAQPDYDHVDQWVPHQCEWCRYYAYFENDDDYGVCCNEASPNDGRVCFEHAGCAKHSDFERPEGVKCRE